MTKTAKTILNMTNGRTNGYAIVSEEVTNIECEVLNNYDKETSIYIFEDGSMILLCSKDFSMKIVYRSTLPLWVK